MRRPVRTIGAVTDVSDRMRADAAVRESSERFRLLAEAIDGAFWMADVHPTRVRYVSPAFERIFGVPAAALMADADAFFGLVHPDDAERVRRELRGQLLGQPFDHEYRILRPDNAVRWIRSRGYPVRNPEGQVTRYAGVAEDITERSSAEVARRESDERFREVGENIHEVFWMTDAATRKLLYISPGYEEIWGRSRESLYANPATWLEAIHPDDRDRVATATDAGTGGASYDETYRITRPDGSLRWIRDRGFPVQDAGDDVRRIDGCGMSADIQARIFDPFFTTKPVDVGTGLGLSMVHGIVQSHDGVIVVQSEPGKGSIFRVYLLATAAFVAEVAAQPASRPPPGRRMLYVDDEEPLVYLAERMLQRRGYDVVGCTSPHDGLARFGEAPAAIDVVVTDIAMPGMTGFEFAGAVLELRADTPVVMTWGHTRPEDHAEATRIGVEALVLKPNTVDELCDVIDGIARKAATRPRRA